MPRRPLAAKLLLLLAAAASLTGCGSDLGDKLNVANLFGNKAKEKKTPCPDAPDGFYVCLSASSSVSDDDLLKAMANGLLKLHDLVGDASFQNTVATHWTDDSGDGVMSTLLDTNYIVTVTGYCDANSDTLARAIVNGDTISYNECTVEHDDTGAISVAAVSGVLLHEISHNLGYDHAEVNPSMDSVPYYLGNLADSTLGGGDAATTTTQRPNRRRHGPGM